MSGTTESTVDDLSVLPLGVGRGADGVFHGHCSTSLLICRAGRPLLLVDAGFGVVRAHQRLAGDLACPLYISHNHSDHAAELPIIGPVMRRRGVRLSLLAERGVMDRLREHRLHELRSAGEPLEHFFDFHALDPLQPHTLAPEHITLRLVRGAHSERSFGFVLAVRGIPRLGVSADSGFDERVYQALAAAPTVVLDGREAGGAEHASFDEIEAWADSRPDVAVWVTGYGETGIAPHAFRLCRPGQALPVAAGTARHC